MPKAYSYIRWSTDIQSLGNTEQRQLERSRAYAEANGLQLVEEMRDSGISAFRGKNVAEGKLGSFLQAVKSNKIQKGSTLIVESLDRLSRQQVNKSLRLFLDIIDMGITIVTLSDNHVYKEPVEMTDLIMSIVTLSRSNEESETKRQRVSAAWHNKRKNAATVKLTAMCPAWLKLSNGKFELIKDRVKIIKSIFESSANGNGNFVIMKNLNDKGVPTFGRGESGWRASYINKILNSRAVLGEFQPCRLVNNQQVPDGDPIPNYFPAIINEELFYRTTKARQQRRRTGRGRKGKTFSNLFSGLAKCSYCKAPMLYEDHGKWVYLVCSNAKRKLKCERHSWDYKDFETSFLMFVKELDLESLTIDHTTTTKKNALENEIITLQGKLAVAETALSNLIDFAAVAKGSKALAKKLGDMEKALEELQTTITAKHKEREELSGNGTAMAENHEQVKELIARLQSKHNAEETYKLRATVAARLKGLITSLYVAPIGAAPLGKGFNEEEMKLVSKRFFSVGFREGGARVVLPHADNPMQYDVQFVSDKGDKVKMIKPKKK
jgi:DNA invertase Pin-like site-specific DNA recombinase